MCTAASGSTFALGSTTVDCTATDAHGNRATGSFAVLVEDTTAPVLDLPADRTVEAEDAFGAVVSFTVMAIDAVDGTFEADCDPQSGSTFPLGSTRVDCTAFDSHGNPVTGSFTVTVRDTTAPATPSITGPPSPTRQTSAEFILEAASPEDTLLCDLDGAGFSPCTSPHVYAGPLSPGPHVFSLKSVDPSSNESASVPYHWVIDPTAPAITLSGFPLDHANSPTASFAFFADEASVFTCQLDGAPATACEPDPSDPGNASRGRQGYSGPRRWSPRVHRHGDGRRRQHGVARLPLGRRSHDAGPDDHRRPGAFDPQQRRGVRLRGGRGGDLPVPARRDGAGDALGVRPRSG